MEEEEIGDKEQLKIRLYNRQMKRVRLIIWLNKPYTLQIYSIEVYSPYYDIKYQQCDGWQKYREGENTLDVDEQEPMKFRV